MHNCSTANSFKQKVGEDTAIAKYELHIHYKKNSGKERLKEIIVCKDMMEATMTRLGKKEDPTIEKMEVLPHYNNDFPFDQPDLFQD